jgi:hypothetical protein
MGRSHRLRWLPPSGASGRDRPSTLAGARIHSGHMGIVGILPLLRQIPYFHI